MPARAKGQSEEDKNASEESKASGANAAVLEGEAVKGLEVNQTVAKKNSESRGMTQRLPCRTKVQ